MNKTVNKSQFFKSLQIIYTALMLGVLVFSVFVYFSTDTLVYKVETESVYIMVVPIVALLGIFLSTFLYKMMLSKINMSDTLQTKMSKYQTANILKGALLEGPALLASIIVMQSNNLLFFVFTAVLVLIMYTRFPTKTKFENEVPLTAKDKSELNRN